MKTEQVPTYIRVPYYCALERSLENSDEYLGVIWRWGGTIAGCHQPWVVLEIFSSKNEARTRVMVEEAFPGIEYSAYPSQLDDGTYEVKRQAD